MLYVVVPYHLGVLLYSEQVLMDRVLYTLVVLFESKIPMIVVTILNWIVEN